MRQRRFEHQRGQVLLVIVLLITIATTIGLSIATRSIVNLRLSAEEDHTQRAFSAAEAGLEQSLLSDLPISNGTFSNSATYDTQIISNRNTSFLLNTGKPVLKDNGADIWLSDYSTDPARNYQNPWNGQLTINWGKQGDVCATDETMNTQAALEVIVITGSTNAPRASRYVFDPCAARRASNNFGIPQPGGTVSGTTFANSARITVGGNGLVARVIPLYATTFMAVTGDSSLPQQGTTIESTGEAGDVKRKVVVFREYPSLPAELFAYSFLWPK